MQENQIGNDLMADFMSRHNITPTQVRQAGSDIKHEQQASAATLQERAKRLDYCEALDKAERQQKARKAAEQKTSLPTRPAHMPSFYAWTGEKGGRNER